MAPNRDEFNKLLALKQEKAKKEQLYYSTVLKQAAVQADQLTKNEHWDYYLRLLQGKLEEAISEKMGWMEKAACAFTADDIKLSQTNYAIYSERVKTLEEVMSLPQMLMSVNTEVTQ